MTRLIELQNSLGHFFSDINLLMNALHHSSLDDGVSNERLEFLGDRVLGLVMAEYLFNHTTKNEGDMADRLNFLVRRETCAQIAVRLSLGEAIFMTTGEESTGGRKKTALLANGCEAVLGAIFLDVGYEETKKIVLNLWKDFLDQFPAQLRDYKSLLQEWSQHHKAGLPLYTVISRAGTDHQPVFTIQAEVKGFGVAQGVGTSKKLAQNKAAENLYTSLKAGQS